MITVTSPTEVHQDGLLLGKVCDAIANNHALAPDIQVALEAYDAARTANFQEQISQLTARLAQ
jgi:hypothetical protein